MLQTIRMWHFRSGELAGLLRRGATLEFPKFLGRYCGCQYTSMHEDVLVREKASAS